MDATDFTEGLLRLPPHIEAQIEKLIQAIPRPRYSATVERMLQDHGLVTEDELAELRGVDVATIQIQRSRGQLPPHYRWGARIFYDAADVAELIRETKTETAAGKRRRLTKGDLLK